MDGVCLTSFVVLNFLFEESEGLYKYLESRHRMRQTEDRLDSY